MTVGTRHARFLLIRVSRLSSFTKYFCLGLPHFPFVRDKCASVVVGEPCRGPCAFARDAVATSATLGGRVYTSRPLDLREKDGSSTGEPPAVPRGPRKPLGPASGEGGCGVPRLRGLVRRTDSEKGNDPPPPGTPRPSGPDPEGLGHRDTPHWNPFSKR